MNKSITAAAMVLTLSLSSAPIASAHVVTAAPGQEDQLQVSASEAKRLVRRYLSEQGYSKSLGPGGAGIRAVHLVDHNWAIDVVLRDDSRKYVVYVDGLNGQIRQTAEKTYSVR
jgi:hypothetical protein